MQILGKNSSVEKDGCGWVGVRYCVRGWSLCGPYEVPRVLLRLFGQYVTPSVLHIVRFRTLFQLTLGSCHSLIELLLIKFWHILQSLKDHAVLGGSVKRGGVSLMLPMLLCPKPPSCLATLKSAQITPVTISWGEGGVQLLAPLQGGTGINPAA